jgi:hypothetical protein
LAVENKPFMGRDPVHVSLKAIAERLDELGIAYSVAGEMALVAHGYVRATVDVALLVRAEDLPAMHERLDGHGYVPVFAGSKNLRDTETGVRIEFLLAGHFPGDGKPKPVAFPDPIAASQEIDGIRCLRLEPMLELKLASGMSNPGRLRDLADDQELIRTRHLPLDLSEALDPSVRERYRELWEAVEQSDDPI